MRLGKGISTFTNQRGHFDAEAQNLEHCRPSLGQNFVGQHWQSFDLPRSVPNAGRGLVVEVHGGKLMIVQDAGDKAANDRDRDLVSTLCGLSQYK
jgi:hypothetical protein